jgi:curved DNA-binding protein
MSQDPTADHYETLQISPNAEADTIHRVYRLLAQRLHPDNAETGNAGQFRMLTDAYQAISDPEQRARYDVMHARLRQERWRLVSSNDRAENDFEAEHLVRLTLLEVLYARRRIEPDSPAVSPLDLETLIGKTREQLHFTIWYLLQKKYVTRADNSMMVITAEGVEYLEGNYRDTQQRRRLTAAASVPAV